MPRLVAEGANLSEELVGDQVERLQALLCPCQDDGAFAGCHQAAAIAAHLQAVARPARADPPGAVATFERLGRSDRGAPGSRRRRPRPAPRSRPRTCPGSAPLARCGGTRSRSPRPARPPSGRAARSPDRRPRPVPRRSSGPCRRGSGGRWSRAGHPTVPGLPRTRSTGARAERASRPRSRPSARAHLEPCAPSSSSTSFAMTSGCEIVSLPTAPRTDRSTSAPRRRASPSRWLPPVTTLLGR